MNTLNLKSFVDSYLHTAAWTSCDSDECTSFTKEAKQKAKEDCQKFIDLVTAEYGERAEKILTTPGNDLTYLVPHDLFLTRNRHGAGFWDKESVYGKDVADKLTKLSQTLGESNCFHIAGKRSKLTFE